MAEERELSGILFNDGPQEEGSNKPQFTGRIMIEGKLWRLAGWPKQGQSGKRFLSLKASEPQAKQGGGGPTDPPSDDDIPFISATDPVRRPVL